MCRYVCTSCVERVRVSGCGRNAGKARQGKPTGRQAGSYAGRQSLSLSHTHTMRVHSSVRSLLRLPNLPFSWILNRIVPGPRFARCKTSAPPCPRERHRQTRMRMHIRMRMQMDRHKKQQRFVAYRSQHQTRPPALGDPADPQIRFEHKQLHATHPPIKERHNRHAFVRSACTHARTHASTHARTHAQHARAYVRTRFA